MSTVDALNRTLDEDIWMTLHALADFWEEKGENELAKGYRWLAQNRKIPWKNEKKEWSWYLVEEEYHQHPCGYHLPLPLSAASPRCQSVSPALSSAYLFAAQKMSKLLTEQGELK